ncbi:MAG TPA: class I SAM-dependent methyltransferase [Longimicrobiales bacterium]
MSVTLSPAAHRTGTVHRVRTACRACGRPGLEPFLDLGMQPLANAFPRSPAEFADEARFPLAVYFCDECSLVQLADVIDPEVLFRDYIYVTGTSTTIAAHNVAYARTVADLLNLDGAALVIEVASNDGSLLRRFAERGVRTLGVEPASNIAALARASGVETVNEFFNLETARSLRERYGPAKAVIGNNVLAHVDDTRDFLAGFGALLDDGGLAIVEVPYVRDLVDRLEYDTVYHEHLCYFSVTALARVCDEVGLRIVRVDHVPVHGGSIRVYAERSSHGAAHAPEVRSMMERERSDGLADIRAYRDLASAVARTRSELLDLLRRLRESGSTIAAYGAPAKGNTLLNYCGIGTDLVDYTVDRNALKVGRYTPGMHLPVLPVETLLERRPDYVLILAWNFADEIMEQQRAYREGGGRFILPIPQPRVVS